MSGSFLISSQSPVEDGTLTLSGILAAPQGFSLYVHEVHSTMTWSSYGDMAIVRRHGHCMGTWSLYMDMAIIQGHGHYTGTWPLYVDMDMLRKYKGYNHALYCLVIVMIFESTPTFSTHQHILFKYGQEQ